MDNAVITRYFLGANSCRGFASLYEDFVDLEKGDFLWVLKGGPGCGKSGFMQKIARAAAERGLDAELICCSGDPDSLDGVYIPALGVAYADGTAPHVMDAVFPAARSLYLDLGAFYDREALAAHFGEIRDLNGQYKALYARAYALLSAAENTAARHLPGLVTEAERAAVRRRADGFIARELGRKAARPGGAKRRFLSAVSCQGELALADTVSRLCGRVCVLDDALGLAAVFLDRVAEAAAALGEERILCPDPLCPDRLEALLLPGPGLALLAGNGRLQCPGAPYRHFRLDAMADRQRIAGLRSRLRAADKLRCAILDNAVENLAEAKRLHDRLERVYNPYVDFSGVYALAQRHIEQLF